MLPSIELKSLTKSIVMNLFLKKYSMIEKYNQIVEEIVKAYALRHFKELYELDDSGYQIYIDHMDYK